MEAQAAGVCGLADAGECRALFGDGEAAGGTHLLVHMLEQGDGFEVLAPTVVVGNPLASRARVVAVEHACHRVHAKAVDAPALHPVERTAGQKGPDFRAPEVVDQRVPVPVEALFRVLVFIERRAIKARHAEGISREMRRHPIQQQAKAMVMAGVNEQAKLRRVAKAPAGGKKAQGLVAPRAIERMLADGQQFDVREAQPGHVSGQAVGQLLPSGEAAVPPLAPALGMHFVNADGRIAPIGFGTPGRQLALGGQAGHHTGGFGAHFCRGGIGVGLEGQQSPVRALDLVLVEIARLHVGDEQLPHAGVVSQAHDVAPPIPAVERPHHGDPLRIGRPDGKARARSTFQAHGVCAKDFVHSHFVPVAQAAHVVVAQAGAKGVGVEVLALAAVLPKHLKLVLGARPFKGTGKEVGSF